MKYENKSRLLANPDGAEQGVTIQPPLFYALIPRESRESRLYVYTCEMLALPVLICNLINRCCVKSCDNAKTCGGKLVSFHRFPTDCTWKLAQTDRRIGALGRRRLDSEYKGSSVLAALQYRWLLRSKVSNKVSIRWESYALSSFMKYFSCRCLCIRNYRVSWLFAFCWGFISLRKRRAPRRKQAGCETNALRNREQTDCCNKVAI